MRLQAVIFDFDGVLCNTVDYHYQSWKRVTEEFGIPFSRADNDKLLGLTRRQSLETILNGRFLPEERIDEILERKNAYYMESVAKMTQDDLLPGVLELLRELTSNGVKTAVASASRNAAVVVQRLKIDSLMDVIVDGNTVKRSKPAPDVYLEAMACLNVPSEGCIAVEDSQAGVEAAQVAGLCVIGIGPQERLAQADVVFSGLEFVRLKNLLDIHSSWLGSR